MQRTLSARRRLLAVFCGGFLGTLTRYLLSVLIQAYLGKEWPYDILFINVSGAFLIALITTLAEATFLIGPTRRLCINVGFLGAYTTFSTLALGDVSLFAHGLWFPALLYMATGLLGGVFAVILGDALGQYIVRRRRTADTVKMSRRTAYSVQNEMHAGQPQEREMDSLFANEQSDRKGSPLP